MLAHSLGVAHSLGALLLEGTSTPWQIWNPYCSTQWKETSRGSKNVAKQKVNTFSYLYLSLRGNRHGLSQFNFVYLTGRHFCLSVSLYLLCSKAPQKLHSLKSDLYRTDLPRSAYPHCTAVFLTWTVQYPAVPLSASSHCCLETKQRTRMHGALIGQLLDTVNDWQALLVWHPWNEPHKQPARCREGSSRADSGSPQLSFKSGP